ncbi:hypothetical protein D3C84_867520 [compost metagenome]
MAEADASFKTVIDSISLLFKKFNGFLACELPKPTLLAPGLTSSFDNGIPSTTNKGVLPLLIEPTPRIVTFTPAPGSPLVLTTRTPATFPCNNWSGEIEIPCLKLAASNCVTAPVTSFLDCFP